MALRACTDRPCCQGTVASMCIVSGHDDRRSVCRNTLLELTATGRRMRPLAGGGFING